MLISHNEQIVVIRVCTHCGNRSSIAGQCEDVIIYRSICRVRIAGDKGDPRRGSCFTAQKGTSISKCATQTNHLEIDERLTGGIR